MQLSTPVGKEEARTFDTTRAGFVGCEQNWKQSVTGGGTVAF